MNIKLNIKKLDDRAIIPSYGSEYAAGADLYAVLDEPLNLTYSLFTTTSYFKKAR